MIYFPSRFRQKFHLPQCVYTFYPRIILAIIFRRKKGDEFLFFSGFGCLFSKEKKRRRKHGGNKQSAIFVFNVDCNFFQKKILIRNTRVFYVIICYDSNYIKGISFIFIFIFFFSLYLRKKFYTIATWIFSLLLFEICKYDTGVLCNR